MARAGYVRGHKSRGNYFFYVKKSFRNDQGKPDNKSIYALGQKEKALAALNLWLQDPSEIPEVLKKYKKEDFEKWIEYVKSK